MAAPPPLLLLLLLSAGALLPSSEAQAGYRELPPSLQRGVDLALEKLHSHAAIQQHLVFLRSLSTSDIQVRAPPPANLTFPWGSQAMVCVAGWVRRGLHLPPLLPEGHHVSQRDGGRLGVPPQERQGESVFLCRRVRNSCWNLSSRVCAAADRLRRLLQNPERGDRAAAQALHPLHPQNGADAGSHALLF